MNENAVVVTEDEKKFEHRAPGVPVVQDDPQGFMAMVERLSANPNVDVDKFERIMNMQERIVDKAAEQLYNASMVEAQSKMPIVPEDGYNNQTKSYYSKLKTVLQYTAPVYTAEGFSISLYEGKSEADGLIRVMADVMHSGGHTKQYWVDIPMDDKGPQGTPNKTQTHGKVSSLTYGQGKLVKMIFNIPTGEGDDDGNGAGSEVKPEYISTDQVTEINDLLKETGVAEDKILKFASAKTIEEITTSSYQKIIKKLNRNKLEG